MEEERNMFLRALALVVFSIYSVHSLADYPEKPIRLVLPIAPGGTTDIVARIVAQRLQEKLGQPLIVENRPGAANIVGTELVSKAEPDGYTLLMATSGHATNPSVYAKLPYDSAKGFSPIIHLTSTPNVFAVPAASPIKDVKELVKLAREKPGTITYSHAGLGQTQHLAGELLGVMANVNIVHVPYKGGAPAIVDALSGQVTMVIAGVPPLVPHIKSGKLRPIAVTSPKRFETLPDVPTIAEQGYAGYEVDFWVGMMAPAGTPVSVVKRMNAEANEVLRLPEVRRQLLDKGAEPVGGTPQDFEAMLTKDMEKWARLVKTIGLKPQ
jgi:tripartite-type tricarboxylate transporter receptor subunit TctC